MNRPDVVVFDVNETLSDLSPMAARFGDVGAPPELAQVWFASLLRDGFALAAAGDGARFARVGGGILPGLLHGLRLDRAGDDAVAHIMAGFSELGLHDDVPDGVRALSAAGLRLVTLTNGSTEVAQRLLAAGGLRDHFERLLSVETHSAWKPAPDSYAYAASACRVRPEQLLLVAVHPWDIHGAARAGLQTCWLNRDGRPYPAYFRGADHTISRLSQLVLELAS